MRFLTLCQTPIPIHWVRERRVSPLVSTRAALKNNDYVVERKLTDPFRDVQCIQLTSPLPLFENVLVKDKIWFTYKARIQAHIRLSHLELHSQFLLVWYAILGAALSAVTIKYPNALGADTDLISAVLSIGLLAISLAVTNRDFRGRSIAMRQNYLELQILYNSISSQAEITCSDREQYHRLLCAVENHSDMDDRIFRVLHSSSLSSRKPRKIDYAWFFAYVVAQKTIIFTLYTAPFAAWLVV